MKSDKQGRGYFILYVIIAHIITYFIFGFIASSVFNYKALFEMPIIEDYYRPYGSISNILGPLTQVVRGFIFALVLLPLKNHLKGEKLGWLQIWIIIIGIGIIGTPAASPGSIEGVVYSKLPLWFHLLGLPEIVFQTLVFSIIVHNKISDYKILKSSALAKIVNSLSIACFSFIGYSIISIIFALVLGARIEKSSADLKIIGQFAFPILCTAVFVPLVVKSNLVKHIVLYSASCISIFFYQTLILGDGNIFYSVIAPILPVAISYFLQRKKV